MNYRVYESNTVKRYSNDMMVSPGVKFLITNAPVISLSSFLLYFASGVLHETTRGVLPRWAVVPITVALLPVLNVIHREWIWFKDRRRAASLGAVMPPLIPDKYPFYLGSLAMQLNSFLYGYPGTDPP